MEQRQGLSRFIFLASTGALLLHFGCCFYGHFGYDDLHYARLAAALNEGYWDPADHYSYRLSLLLPTALAYRFFGVSDLASALPPLLMSMGILWVLYRRHGASALGYSLAVLLYFSFRWNLFYADKLMPDIYVSGFAFLAWDVYTRSADGRRMGWHALLFVLYLFLAFNAKGTVILLVPLLVVYGLYDLWCKKATFWWQVAGWGTIIFGTYFLLTRWFLGHPLARFRAIAANAYSNDCSYTEQDWSVLWERLSSGFLNLVYQEGLLLPLLIGILALAYYASAREERQGEQTNRLANPLFYSGTIVLLYLGANTMTISFSGYNPVCLDARHWLFVSPIAASCAASLLQYFLAKCQPKWQRHGQVFLLLLGLWGAKGSISLAAYSRGLGYADVKKEIKLLLQDTMLAGKRVLASPVLVNLAAYLAGFPSEASLDFKDSKITPLQPGDYIVKNWYCDWHAQLAEGHYEQLLKEQGLKSQPSPKHQHFVLLTVESVE